MSNAYRSTLAGGGAAVGDATAADVLSGKTFSGAVGSGVTGTMTNNGAVSQTVAAGQSYTIPEGYHNGNGTVTGAGASYESFIVIPAADFASTGIQVTAGRTYLIHPYVTNTADPELSVTGGTIVKTLTTANQAAKEYVVQATGTTLTGALSQSAIATNMFITEIS